MLISDISNRYKNRVFEIFSISIIYLIAFPVTFFLILKNFTGFGYIIINSQIILNFILAVKILVLIGLLIPIIILVISIITGLNRKKIIFFFPLLTSFVIFTLITYFIFIAIIFSFILFCILNEFTSFRPTLLILFFTISLVFLKVIPVTIRGVFKFTKDENIFRIGVVISKKDHPKFFDLIKQVAIKTNSREPKNIVIGLTTDFYVVAKGMVVLDGIKENKIDGETLYISIPFLRVLTINELRGILGHELAHFSGEDTSYAIKFAPVYRKLNDQFISFEQDLNDEDSFNKYVLKIAIYPLVFLFNEFYRKDMKISKIREYRADEIGVQACGSAKDFINGLFKIFIYATVWDWVEKDHYEIVKNKFKIDNINKSFMKEIKSKIDPSNIEPYLKEYLQYQQKHPNDTHPTGYERMKNLKIKLKEINKDTLTKFNPSSASLFKDLKIIEERLTYIMNRIIEYQK